MLTACKEVGPALFFSLLIITVSFLPVFTLEGQEGRLFSPLAYTKTFSMAGAAILSVTLVPVLMLLFIRGKIMPEAKNPVNRVLIWVYRPIIATVMRWKKTDHRPRGDRCWPYRSIPPPAWAPSSCRP
jgi:Cu(I)/Ag(I) efflux system membrane protein CusA/SilA